MNRLESVDQKGLNHLFAPKAHLGRAERSKAGGGEALSVFLVIQPRNHHTLLQIGRSESKLAHHQLLFHLATSCPHGKHLVCFSAPGTQETGPFPQPGCHVKSGLVLPRELICTTCFNLKGSRKTEWTPVFGIRLVFIHSALVLTGAE